MNGIYPVVSVLIPYRTGPSNERTWVMVQEKDSGLWGQPGGRVDFSDRDYVNAATREVREESGLTIVIKGLIGFYFFQSLNKNQILCTSLLGEHVEGVLTPTEDVVDAKEMTLADIRKLNAEGRLRSGLANVKPIEDYLRRGTFSIDEVFHFIG